MGCNYKDKVIHLIWLIVTIKTILRLFIAGYTIDCYKKHLTGGKSDKEMAEWSVATDRVYSVCKLAAVDELAIKRIYHV